MGRLWREQGKLQVFYLYKILARLETAFLFATIAVILSFPLSGLYFLAEKTGSSVYILDAWLLALNNTYTHLYLTAAFLFSISRMPRYGASVLFPSLHCSRGVAYMAAAVRLDAPGGFRGPGNSSPVHPVVCTHRVRTE